MKPKVDQVRKNETGVYAVIHTPSGRAFVGSSKRCIRNRFSWHLASLKSGNHNCVGLLGLWKKSRLEDWHLKVLEFCPPEEARSREEYWMAKYELLNTIPAAFRGEHTPEMKIILARNLQRLAADPIERLRRKERAKEQHRNGKLGFNTIKDKVRWRENIAKGLRAAKRGKKCKLVSPTGEVFTYHSIREAAKQHNLKTH